MRPYGKIITMKYAAESLPDDLDEFKEMVLQQ